MTIINWVMADFWTLSAEKYPDVFFFLSLDYFREGKFFTHAKLLPTFSSFISSIQKLFGCGIEKKEFKVASTEGLLFSTIPRILFLNMLGILFSSYIHLPRCR